MKIYGVTTGSYSEYQVVALFESTVDAQDFIQRARISDAEVEEFNLYPTGEQPAVGVHWFASAEVWNNGTSEDIHTWSHTWTVKPHGEPKVNVRKYGSYTHGIRIVESGKLKLKHSMVEAVYQDSKEAAIKKVSDRVAQIKAELSKVS